MSVLRDMEVLDVSHKYNLSPCSMKAQAFTLFERGYSTRDVGYLLRRFRNGKSRLRFSSTIRRYHGLWKSKQDRYIYTRIPAQGAKPEGKASK